MNVNIIMKKLLNENFNEEVLNNVMAVLEAQTVSQVRPAGFLEEKEACDYCGNISRSTLWHWTKRGLRSYKVGGRRLYRPEDLDGFIHTITQTGTIQVEEN